jgi:hypothetical protein
VKERRAETRAVDLFPTCWISGSLEGDAREQLKCYSAHSLGRAVYGAPRLFLFYVVFSFYAYQCACIGLCT